MTKAIDVIRNGFKSTQDPLLGLELATHLDRSGESELAAGIYKVLLERFPNMTAAANNYAMLLIRGAPSQENLNKAAELVKQFEISNNPIYLDTLGWVFLKQGKSERAIDVLKRAVKGQEDNPEIRYHLGAAYYEAGRTEDAKKELEMSLASGAQFEGWNGQDRFWLKSARVESGHSRAISISGCIDCRLDCDYPFDCKVKI